MADVILGGSVGITASCCVGLIIAAIAIIRVITHTVWCRCWACNPADRWVTRNFVSIVLVGGGLMGAIVSLLF